MEKLQGPINPCIIAEEFEVGWLEEFISNNGGNFKVEDPYYHNTTTEDTSYGDLHYSLPSLEDKMPFLQMLQSVEQQQQQHQQQQCHQLMHLEPNFQFLLKLQHQKLNFFPSPEIESCVTTTTTTHNNNHNIDSNNHNNDMIIKNIMDNLQCHHQGVKSEGEIHQQQQIISSSGVVETLKCKNSNSSSRSKKSATCCSTSTVVVGLKEKRKRKRTTRPAKNKEEVETQRMTHIAVERNRRRQMNEHLNALRSLMPPSYVQRGDQASIIGGAIDFVKELEQMLQSLQAQKRMRQYEENGDVSISSSSTSSSSNLHYNNIFMASPSSSFHQLRNQFHSHEEGNGNGNGNSIDECMMMRKSNNNEEYSAEKRSDLADIEVVVIQNHVNLKIQCQRRAGQLLKAIVAFEELRLTVLHLNITSLHALVHYSFNLKIEDDCRLGSADEVARAVHQIFSLINLS
ncbi:transcription factor bHLH67 [Beta vulgaris subsp. vulgaris]|uniref:transcription factor bHLH67 n=1 Tax=Beta vulgaris subsp. vulgaris TaxID=3555 RepID=UPI002036AC42|nr:transcription factor bHLH67 [Beta vulgaris subsp. vulgaris]